MSIEAMLAEVRARIDRLEPVQACAAMRAGALLIDLRPVEYRRREGEIPGAVAVSRHVLEWRLDPTSDARLPLVTGHDQQMVLICSEGYTSSLAAGVLLDLGLTEVSDVIGGFAAWSASGLPTVRRDVGLH